MYVKLKQEHTLKALKVDSGTPFRDYIMFFGAKLVDVSWISGTKRCAAISYRYPNPIKQVEEIAHLIVPFDNFTIVENVDGTYFALNDETFHTVFEKVDKEDN